ncbi:CmpA/NrtA family ABC transporter substrate-binding protein [Salinisphaera aquimarina]|uniref:CmpA/NrtA family ABC transporter substrate-binding protein n=1 Tax=Salinisphaera aquimarina TaxID=2094031 RepID=A0ABV7EIF1_9GAMM
MTAWHEAHFGRKGRYIGKPHERDTLKLGFIALTDCAPLVIASEAGFFEAEGLGVELSRESSWAAIRDKVALGLLDGAQMLAGMPIASTLGVGALPHAMVTALSLGLNGNAITVSTPLYERMRAIDPAATMARPCSASALKQVIDQDRAAGLAPLTFGMVHPASMHNYQLRYWLAAAGIDPDRDVNLIVVPPARMVANIEAGRLAGYCVGEPWNQLAVRAGLGHALITGYEIWNNAPEKVLGVTREWALANPRTHRALIRAIVRAGAWLDNHANCEEAADTLADTSYVDAPAEVIRRTLTGRFCYHPGAAPRPAPDFNVFNRYAANFPWRSHAMWFISQMIRWSQISAPVDIAMTAGRVYRPDIYRDAVAPLGIVCPDDDYKSEGTHPAGWSLTAGQAPDRVLSMGADAFFDGGVFEPRDVLGYLAAHESPGRTVRLRELAELNPSFATSVAG